MANNCDEFVFKKKKRKKREELLFHLDGNSNNLRTTVSAEGLHISITKFEEANANDTIGCCKTSIDTIGT